MKRQWVRRALHAAIRRNQDGNVRRKLDAVRRAASHAFPTADMDAMLGEIERGYIGGRP